MNIALETSLAKLPIDEIKESIQKHIRPMAEQLPDKRLKRVLEDMVLGILDGGKPVIAEIARQNSKDDGESWAVAKRMYRLLEHREQLLWVLVVDNPSFEHVLVLISNVLLSAQLVFVIAFHWPPKAVLWLRQLGGKLGIVSDRDGPYWLLHGISAVIVTAMTLSFAFLHPFPFADFTCG